LAEEGREITGKAGFVAGDAGVADGGLQGRQRGAPVGQRGRPCRDRGAVPGHAPMLSPRNSGRAGSASAFGRRAGPNRLLWTLLMATARAPTMPARLPSALASTGTGDAMQPWRRSRTLSTSSARAPM